MRKIFRSLFFVCTVVTVFSLIGSEEEEEKRRAWSVLTVAAGSHDDLTGFVVSPDDSDRKPDNADGGIQVELAPVNPDGSEHQTWLQRIDNERVKGRWPALLRDMHRHAKLDEEDHDYVIDQLNRNFCGDFDPTAVYTHPQRYDISLNGQLIALYYRIGYQLLYPKEKRLEKDIIDANFTPFEMMLLPDSSKKWYTKDCILVSQIKNGLHRQHRDGSVTLVQKPATLEVWRKKRIWRGCGWEEYWDRKCFDGAVEDQPTCLVCDEGGRRAALLFEGNRLEVYNIEPGARNDKRAEQMAISKTIERLIFADKAQTLTTVHPDSSATVFKWNKGKQKYDFSTLLSLSG